jgi:hypothetical protein
MGERAQGDVDLSDTSEAEVADRGTARHSPSRGFQPGLL